MGKTQKKDNCSIIVICNDLELHCEMNVYSPAFQKVIKELQSFKKKRKVIYSYPEFLESVMNAYEQGYLAFLAIQSIGDVVDFLYRNFEIRMLRKPEKEMSKEHLRTVLYKFKDLNK